MHSHYRFAAKQFEPNSNAIENISTRQNKFAHEVVERLPAIPTGENDRVRADLGEEIHESSSGRAQNNFNVYSTSTRHNFGAFPTTGSIRERMQPFAEKTRLRDFQKMQHIR